MAEEGRPVPSDARAGAASSFLADASAPTQLSAASNTMAALPNDGQPHTSHPATKPPHSQREGTRSPTSMPSGASQAMAVTTSSASSSSSDHSVLGANSAPTGAPSPYGTRSRNRVGGTRPNYAEDRDTETENEPTVTTGRRVSLARSARHEGRKTSGGQPEARAAAGVSTRQAASQVDAASNGTLSPKPSSVQAKDQIPGTSAFPAHVTGAATAPPAKRRKLTAAEKKSPSPATATTGASMAQKGARRRRASVKSAAGIRESNMLSFEDSQGYLKHGKLKADDGTTLRLNDHVYLVCEPPGEPYYLARVMEFLHVDNQQNLPVDSIRVNWYYRPRDINRKVTDTRVVFATMHSDICPLTSLRGKCQIMHRSEIDDIDEYRKTKDCFWYEKLFDRYIHRYYDVIPVSQVINVPVKVKKVLDERWKFLVVEAGRGKELTSAVKSCRRCGGYCAIDDSVECAVCRSTYHMNCVNPPLLKKPSRGFAWACGPCNRAQERKLEARNVPLIKLKFAANLDEDEVLEDEEEDGAGRGDTGVTSAASEGQDTAVDPATAEQTAHAKLWPYRYLGQHCRVEDALDYDDRIYPRASSRLGPRHQAVVMPWPGRPIEYVKAADVKRRYGKGAGKQNNAKLWKEAVAALEGEKLGKGKRPRWVQDEPPGYVHRGDDKERGDSECTAVPIFKLPAVGDRVEGSCRGEDSPPSGQSKPQMTTEEREKFMDDYISKAKGLAREIGVKDCSTNLLDKALEILYKNGFDEAISLKQLRKLNRRKLGEPDLSKEEQKRFEEGVSKYGSELHSVTRHVKTQSHADIVRYYYVWKKTDRGMKVWGNYEGRRGKKEAKRADNSKLVDDVADDNDDSAFDEAKAVKRKRGFECKFCGIRTSRQWRRAPGSAPGTIVTVESGHKGHGKDKIAQFLVALCRRCAELWRRYGIQWEDIDEVAKKVAQGGGKAWKRKIDEELLKELVSGNDPPPPPVAPKEPVQSLAKEAGPTTAPVRAATPVVQEPPKKKQKVLADKDVESQKLRVSPAIPTTTEGQKKKAVEKAPVPAPAPEVVKPKLLPCVVCGAVDPTEDHYLACKECRMAVHRDCYGVVGEVRNPSKWVCDMCSNDKNPQVSTSYQCVLCPVRFTQHDMLEPKQMGRKRVDKDREKDKADRDSAFAPAAVPKHRQEDANRPANPREPLKRTAGNNWVHVVCSIWTPETKFGNAKALEPTEGVGTIPQSRYEQVCKVCKSTEGACVPCHQCHASVHVACAKKAGYTLGFDITPVKSSRRELINTVTLGNETGFMSAAVWCKEHVIKTIVHPMDEIEAESGLNALQAYVRNYKQADLTLTGTVRKANLVTQSTKAITQGHGANSGGRRASTVLNGVSHSTSSNGEMKNGVRSDDAEQTNNYRTSPKSTCSIQETSCYTCGISVSPRWWDLVIEAESPMQLLVHAVAGTYTHRPLDLTVRQCHKCHIKGLRERQSTLPGQAHAGLQSPVSNSMRHRKPATVPNWILDAMASYQEPRFSPGGSSSHLHNHPPRSRSQAISTNLEDLPPTHSHDPIQGRHVPSLPPVSHLNANSQGGRHREESRSQPPDGLPSLPLKLPLPPSPASGREGIYPHAAQLPPPPQLSSVSQVHGGPSVIRDHPSTTVRDANLNSSITMSRPELQGRSAGGASASPSLRNLLS